MKIRAKKSLGQNFLVDKLVLQKIVDISNINEKSEVLEVGPGTGNLTEFILKKRPKRIHVVEKDNELSKVLKEKFMDKIIVINDDILKISENLISDQKLIVFGNLPYNISTEILSKWITNLGDTFWFSQLILMFQKEVADRIVAKFNTSNYGRLSILTNWKLNVKKIIDIEPNSFFPIPKIKSSLLLFSPKEKFILLNKSKNLEMITRIFFNQRRKMIKNPFNQIFDKPDEISQKLNIDLNLRPQNLSPEMYFKIVKEYENL